MIEAFLAMCVITVWLLVYGMGWKDRAKYAEKNLREALAWRKVKEAEEAGAASATNSNPYRNADNSKPAAEVIPPRVVDWQGSSSGYGRSCPWCGWGIFSKKMTGEHHTEKLCDCGAIGEPHFHFVCLDSGLKAVGSGNCGGPWIMRARNPKLEQEEADEEVDDPPKEPREPVDLPEPQTVKDS